MVRYPINLEPDDNGTLLVSFPDFPEPTRSEVIAKRR